MIATNNLHPNTIEYPIGYSTKKRVLFFHSFRLTEIRTGIVDMWLKILVLLFHQRMGRLFRYYYEAK